MAQGMNMTDKKSIPVSFNRRLKKRNLLIAGYCLILVSAALIFNFTIVFMPELLNRPLSVDKPIPIGIFIGLALIIGFFLLSMIYLAVEKKFVPEDSISHDELEE